MNKLMLTATAILLTVIGLHAAGAEPGAGFTIHDTCHQYIAVNPDTGQRLTVHKISMHDELNRGLPYTTCVEELVYTGPPTRTPVRRDAESAAEDGREDATTYRVERPVVMRLGGVVDREIAGVIVCFESEDQPSARRTNPPGPRHSCRAGDSLRPGNHLPPAD